jgi:tetratricopeptide (TPR) repeat protein
VPFGELVRFTVEEIEETLGKLKRAIEGDVQELAERLHRITRGVPLAVRALLDLHEEGEQGSVLDDLAEQGSEDVLEESTAVREVIGTVAQRLLYHLSPDRKPEREDDLRDIIALTILQRADGEILRNLWAARRVHDRLRELGARYALLSGGDLHATVRDYLRRYWRDETVRPALFDQELDAVGRAIEALPPLFDEETSPEAISRRTLQLNLRTWRVGDRAVVDLAPALAVAMAYEVGIEEIQALLRELPLTGNRLSTARKVWKKPEGEWPSEQKAIAWLRRVCDGSKTWSDLERASLALIQGIISADWSGKPSDNVPALDMLKAALDFFGPDRLPQPQRAGGAFFDVGSALDPVRSKEKGWETQAVDAYLCAIQLGTHESVCLNNLGNTYAELGQHENAEQVYLKSIELDPKSVHPHNNLGILYENLGRYGESEKAYLKAIELDPKDAYPHDGLGNVYRVHMRRYAEAEKAFLKAIELDPKFAQPHNNLGNLYQDHLCRHAEAEKAYLKGIELDPKSGSGQRGLAWLCLLHTGDLEKAREYADEALGTKPDHPGSPLAMIAVTIWTSGWPAAQSLMPKWLAECPAWYVHRSRPRVVALFRKIGEQGGLPALAEILRGVAHQAHWKPWSDAVSAVAAGSGRDACTTEESKSLYDLLS